MIVANWRRFSGGKRDMYNEVLKYGSMIVDALVKYEKPIFVYIPPYSELSWWFMGMRSSSSYGFILPITIGRGGSYYQCKHDGNVCRRRSSRRCS